MKFKDYKNTIEGNKKVFALPMFFLEKSKFQDGKALKKNILVSFYNGKLLIDRPFKSIIRFL